MLRTWTTNASSSSFVQLKSFIDPYSICRERMRTMSAQMQTKTSSNAWKKPIASNFSIVQKSENGISAMAMKVKCTLEPYKRTHLQRLRLKDFALVERESIEFTTGLNVITGKTGSGKSVLLSAIDQITGAAAAMESIRVPAKTAKIEATFYCDSETVRKIRERLREHGMDDVANAFTKNNDEPMTVDLYRELQSTQNNKLRSLCKIANKAVPVKVLREIGMILIDFNGQNASLAMATEKAQLDELDNWANVKHSADAFEAAMQNVRIATKLVEGNIELTDEEKEEIEDILDAFDKVDPVPHEDARLKQELRAMDSKFGNWETLASAINWLTNDTAGTRTSLKEALYESKSVLSQAERRADQFRNDITTEKGNDNIITFDEDIEAMQEAVDLLHEAEAATDKAEDQIKRYMESLNTHPERKEQIQERLRDLDKLGKKMGKCRTAESMCEIAKELRDKLDAAATSEDEKEGNEKKLRSARKKAANLALELAVARRDAGSQLRNAITAAMNSLEMQGSRFDVTLSWTPASLSKSEDEDWDNAASTIAETFAKTGDEIIDLETGEMCLKANELKVPGCGEIGENENQAYLVRARGLDRATFLLAPGANEPLRPMSSIASGGEKARIHLAMKMAPAMVSEDSQTRNASSSSNPKISVFDEVDTGVGGRVGTKIGIALQKLATRQQVLCVTHLPQVAAFGETHVRVRKDAADEDGRPRIAFDSIERDSRIEEIADMLGIGDTGFENARRLLAEALPQN